jgi:hypothetical protein
LQTSSKTYSNKLLFRNILLAGIVAGTLDALAAIINYYVATGKNPVRIFVFIASGVFGKKAYSWGQSIAIFGVLFHFLIAIIFSAFYFWISPKIKFLHKNKLIDAFLYGIFVWLVMNLVIVPLSNTPVLPFHIVDALLALLILIACVGTPVSFMASSFYRKNLVPYKIVSPFKYFCF